MKMVPVCLAVMVSVGNSPPLGQDGPVAALHPAQVEGLVDRIAQILGQRGRGAFALLGRWHAAGDGEDPDLFVIDMKGRVLFGAPRTVADACGERFVEACLHVAERFGSGWVDGSDPGGASWSYVRETWVDEVEAFVGARVHVNRDGTLSSASPAR
jgi:hypothetical protein